VFVFSTEPGGATDNGVKATSRQNPGSIHRLQQDPSQAASNHRRQQNPSQAASNYRRQQDPSQPSSSHRRQQDSSQREERSNLDLDFEYYAYTIK
jgi:hypothetical protein